MENTKSKNSWLNHVNDYRSQNKDLSYKECLKQAKESYKRPRMADVVEEKMEMEDKSKVHQPKIKEKTKLVKKQFFTEE